MIFSKNIVATTKENGDVLYIRSSLIRQCNFSYYLAYKTKSNVVDFHDIFVYFIEAFWPVDYRITKKKDASYVIISITTSKPLPKNCADLSFYDFPCEKMELLIEPRAQGFNIFNFDFDKNIKREKTINNCNVVEIKKTKGQRQTEEYLNLRAFFLYNYIIDSNIVKDEQVFFNNFLKEVETLCEKKSIKILTADIAYLKKEFCINLIGGFLQNVRNATEDTFFDFPKQKQETFLLY